MTTGAELVELAETQFGDPYVFGFEVRCDDPNPDAFDCSEYTAWVCCRLGIDLVDGAYNQWRTTEAITVAEAIDTEGALLYVGDGTGSGRDAITHVAFSRGDGSTAEARGSAYGTGSWTANGRFDYGGLIPGVDYSGAAPPPPPDPTFQGVEMFVVFESNEPGRARFIGAQIGGVTIGLSPEEYVSAIAASSGVPVMTLPPSVPNAAYENLVRATANVIEG